MNWNTKFEEMQRKITSAENELETLKIELGKQKEEYVECLSFTDKFLKCCKRHKITAVCINTANEIVKESTTFPFGCSYSVFACGKEDGFPAIWEVCEEMDIGDGCGNHNQHSLNKVAMAKLIDGAYQFKDGKWHKID